MQEFDVIVVGAGNAALAAAVSARDSGARKVLVLEKAPREARGGNTHFSGGIFRFAFDRIEQAIDLVPNLDEGWPEFRTGADPYPARDFHSDLMRVTGGQSDPELANLIRARDFQRRGFPRRRTTTSKCATTRACCDWRKATRGA